MLKGCAFNLFFFFQKSIEIVYAFKTANIRQMDEMYTSCAFIIF